MSDRHTELEAVIRDSSVRVLGGGWAVMRPDEVDAEQRHLLTMRIDDEITVVTQEPEPSWPEDVPTERDYTVIALDVAKPFQAPGFLAAACGALGASSINVLVYSGFSRDYVLVRDQDLDAALSALVARGFPRVEEAP